MTRMLLCVYCSINSLSGDRACPASVVFEFVTLVTWRTILMLHKETLDMQRLEVLWSLSLHMSIFWGFESLPPVIASISYEVLWSLSGMHTSSD